MPSFANLDALITDLKQVQRKHKGASKKALKKAGAAIQKDAQKLFGTYQEGWPDLAEATQEKRAKAGYPADEPLLVTGALRDAMTVKVEPDGQSVFIGMEEGVTVTTFDGKEIDAAKLMAVHEYGTIDGRVPARPVFGVIEHRIDPYVETARDAIVKELKL